MRNIRLPCLGCLLLILAACTIIGPEGQFRQPAGTGSALEQNTGADIVGANEVMPKTNDSLEVGTPSSSAPIEIVVGSGSIRMGSAPSTLVIVEDYDCFYCREFGGIDLPWLLSTYVSTKKLSIERVFLPQSAAGTLMAKVALCAAKQNQFEAVDKALHASPVSTDTQVAALAKTHKLNLKNLQTCMASASTGTTLSVMAEDAGVERVPAFRIGADSWLGVLTRDELKKKIDAAL